MNEPHPIGEDELHAYVDGQLPPERRQDVERRLSTNADIRDRVRDYSAQRQALRFIAAARATEPLPATLSVANLLHERLARRSVVSWRVAAAVALAFAIGGIGGAWGGWQFGSRPMAGIAALSEEGAASYVVFTTDQRRPVELWAAQRDDLTRWVSNRLHRPVAPPDLSAVGYQLLGGRLVATGHGPAALFMYENAKGTRLVLLVRPMGDMRTAPVQQTNVGKVEGVAWVDAGLGYSLVAAEPIERLRELSQDVRQQSPDAG